MERTPEVISRLLFERAPWDSVDASYAARIPMDSPHESADLLARMVQSGDVTPFRITFGPERVGLLLVRVEEGSLGRELVVVSAFMQRGDGHPLSREFAAAIEELAAKEGCNVIRFHTVRPGAARLAAEEFGYRITEIVLRKNVRL